MQLYYVVACGDKPISLSRNTDQQAPAAVAKKRLRIRDTALRLVHNMTQTLALRCGTVRRHAVHVIQRFLQLRNSRSGVYNIRALYALLLTCHKQK